MLDPIHDPGDPHIEIEPITFLLWRFRYYDGFGEIPAINDHLFGNYSSARKQAERMVRKFEKKRQWMWENTHVIPVESMEGLQDVDYDQRRLLQPGSPHTHVPRHLSGIPSVATVATTSDQSGRPLVPRHRTQG